MAAFNAEWAYTVDGGGVGELECESFNAASVTIKSRQQRAPGSAKGVMVNALSLALPAFIRRCRQGKTPETTEVTGLLPPQQHQRAAWNAPKYTTSCAISSARDSRRANADGGHRPRVGKGLPRDCYVSQYRSSYYNMREQVAGASARDRAGAARQCATATLNR